MATVLISDLHLGTAYGGDLLRRPQALAALLPELERADRLVLLGDLLELRDAPLGTALAAARPVLGEIGRALAGRPVTIVPGNHDYQLVSWMIDRLRADPDGTRLELETVAAPPSGGLFATVAEALGDAEVSLAYPGVWVRPDVFATHGHYLDVHHTVPTLERLFAGLTGRLIGGMPQGRLRPADYEAILSPLYALTYSLAQASPQGRRLVGGGTSVKAWRALGGSGGRPGLHVRLLAGAGVSGTVAALNRIGLGPLKADLSATELRRAGLEAIGQVVARLGVDADHVVFGHTHRSGPFPGDEGWTLPGGGALINTGSWVHEPVFLGHTPRESPYWPGTCVVVGDDGPPELKRLLDEIPPPA